MKNPVWTLPPAVFHVLAWGAVILLTISIVVILVIFARELRNRRVW